MIPQRLIFFTVALSACVAIGQSTGQTTTASSEREVAATVNHVYGLVAKRSPLGLLRGENRELFYPYLSSDLKSRLNAALECDQDFFQHYSRPDEKAGLAWLELGLFSGPDDEAWVSKFHIQRIEIGLNGTAKARVEMIHADPGKKPWTWNLIALIRPEANRFLLDDVIYNPGTQGQSTLSKALSWGCKDGEWVGWESGAAKQ